MFFPEYPLVKNLAHKYFSVFEKMICPVLSKIQDKHNTDK